MAAGMSAAGVIVGSAFGGIANVTQAYGQCPLLNPKRLAARQLMTQNDRAFVVEMGQQHAQFLTAQCVALQGAAHLVGVACAVIDTSDAALAAPPNRNPARPVAERAACSGPL
jgi:hypothetical protein